MKIIEKLGMPYQGSKRRLAKPLIDFMLRENPNATHFVDVFGGGAAMSFYALQKPQIQTVLKSEVQI